MTIPIALQLYTVREALAQDFEGVIRRVADIGYVGVETAGFPPPVTAEEAATLFQGLGLTVTSAHVPLPLGDEKQQVLDTAKALGCRRLVSGYLPPENYQDADAIKHACDLLNEANEVAVKHGLSFGAHNHWWEFEAVDGQYPYEAWLKYLDPAIFFELDTYWIQTAGHDPAAIVFHFGSRAPLLHIKDGPADVEASMVAVGDGILDFQAIIDAAAGNAEWLIVELDRCATDMMTAVEKSFDYLVESGLGHGR